MNQGMFEVIGFLDIFDPNTGEVLVSKKNAIHYENISLGMALSLADRNTGYIYSMAFGNGGSSVDPTGVITYLPPNTNTQNSNLYNQTYIKVINQAFPNNNTDVLNNKIEINNTWLLCRNSQNTY